MFCYGCFNYLDFCDCIGTDADYLPENVVSLIPDDSTTTEETWYFRFPTKPILDLGNGYLHVLLGVEKLWSKTPPPMYEGQVISIPVSRLPRIPNIEGRPGSRPGPLGPTSPQYPWEMQFFYWNVRPLIVAANLAKELAQCQLKKTPRQRWRCRFEAIQKTWQGEQFAPDMSEGENPAAKAVSDILDNVASVDEFLLLLAAHPEWRHVANIIAKGLSEPSHPEYAWVDYDLHGHVDPPPSYNDSPCSWQQSLNPNDPCFLGGSSPYNPSDNLTPRFLTGTY